MRETRRQHRAKITILFVILLALLAQLFTIRIAHGQEKFITAESAGSVTLQLRDEATIVGGELRIKQIARWSANDNDTLEPIGELIINRFNPQERFKSITLTDLRTFLKQAGVNIAPINFVGPTCCTITRSDIQLPEGKANEQLNKIENKSIDNSKVIFQGPAANASKPAATEPENGENKSLKTVLCENLAEKLKIPVESLQVDFKSEDEGKLRLTQAQCTFDIQPQRTGALGNVSWYVKTTTNGNITRDFISANARAWQDQLVVTRAMAIRQTVTEDCLETKRTLVDRLTDDPLLKKEQAIGQVAARDLRPGMVVTSRMVDAAPMVRPGDFVTIENTTGTVKIRIVARAIDGGCYGQTIRVVNDTTREVSRVTVIGPQQATMGLTGTEVVNK